jgi:hypothetical protein
VRGLDSFASGSSAVLLWIRRRIFGSHKSLEIYDHLSDYQLRGQEVQLRCNLASVSRRYSLCHLSSSNQQLWVCFSTFFFMELQTEKTGRKEVKSRFSTLTPPLYARGRTYRRYKFVSKYCWPRGVFVWLKQETVESQRWSCPCA